MSWILGRPLELIADRQDGEIILRSIGRRTLQFLLQALPVSVRDRLLAHVLAESSDMARFRYGFPTVAGLLEHLKDNGFQPSTVVDIGACVGDWSRMAASILGAPELIMIDANPQNEVFLQQTQRHIGPGCQYRIVLLGAEPGEKVNFYQIGAGSSVLRELTSFEKCEVMLSMETLDGVFGERRLKLPTLMKLDVQGFELQVLRGGIRTLNSAEVVILETALLPYNEGAPLFSEVVAFMQDVGFVVYDFCGQFRRQTDHALFQADVAFVKHDSQLRSPRKFWLSEP